MNTPALARTQPHRQGTAEGRDEAWLCPEISVVVPTWRRPAMLERCLTALVRQTLAPARYEIVVCDDGPDEATRSLVERVADAHRARGLQVRYVPVTATQGPAGARNAGWRAARAETIAFTDDDTIPDVRWLEAGLRAMADGASAASGAIEVPLPERPTDYEYDASGLARAEFATANVFVRRDALIAVDGFDERFTSAWREDSDLQFSLLAAGRRIVSAPEALVVHPVRPARWGVSLSQQRKSAFEALLYRKHPGLYRQRIASTPPLGYYASTAAALTAIASALAHATAIAGIGALVWLVLTLRFFLLRMRGRSLAPAHVAEMAATSVLIPFLSIYWRLRGAIRYRTWFL
ncbi:glycosyltransferase family 2 protein [Trinickia diaoshuihuensis]|uniref:glycosyltransferase family 2 protein n=1 Tax=Trinickia diaoshuihuensis TaxID=2292265 RepID=UPI003B8326D6